MKTLFKSLVLLYVLLQSLTAFAGPMQELKSAESVSAYIEKTGFNGVVLVGKENKTLFKKAYGFRHLETRDKLTTDDRFQIGSNTKQFVAAALLKLQEQGLISLEKSVVEYLPQYKNRIPAEITIRDILNHTSGITNYTAHKEFWESIDPEKILTLDDLIEFTLQYPLDFEPRSKWNYSNSGYIIAGKIIEEVTGESWDKFIENTFLVPLNMKNTGYAERFETVSNVYPHYKDSTGKIVLYEGFNLSWALSAGAMFSTVDDLFKWSEIYSNSTLLTDASRADMQKPFKDNYGLGLMIMPFGKDVLVGHDGKTPGFTSSLFYLKNAQLTVIKLDNINGSIPGIPELLMDFYTRGKVLVVKLDKVQISSEKLLDYAGTYAIGNFEFKVFVQNEKLFLQPNDGQPAYELSANDTDSFNLGGFAGEEFIRDSNGKITGLNHYQDGHVSQFIRK